MLRSPRALFPYARVAAPLAAALAYPAGGAAPWLLAAALVAACIAVIPIRAHPRASIPRSAALFAAVSALVAVVLGYAGVRLAPAAGDAVVPVLAFAVLGAAGSYLGMGLPGVMEVLAAGLPTASEAAALRDRRAEDLTLGMADEDARARIEASVDARGETALAAGVILLLLESSASLFVASGFLAVALASGAAPGWAWQGAAAFAIALASSTASLSLTVRANGSDPITSLGAPLVVPFLVCAIAASQRWNVVLAGAPMVLFALLLAAARPARFPRVVDVLLTLAAIGTAIAVGMDATRFPPVKHPFG